MRETRLVETHQPRGHGGGDEAGHRHLVPNAMRIHELFQPSEDFIPHHDGGEHVGAGAAESLAGGERGRRVVAGMAADLRPLAGNAADIIVEIEHPHETTVGEDGVEKAGAPALADDAAPIGPASLVDEPENGFRRLFPEPRDGAADGVEHDEFRLFHRAGGNVRRSRRGRHGRERLDGAGFRMMLFRHVWT